MPKLVIPSVVVAVLAVLWSAFWFFASAAAQATFTEWRDHEARLGRTYDCGSQTVGGFPFRIELRCTGATAGLRGSGSAIAIAAKEILLVAQVYQPNLLIGEITGPLTVAAPGDPPAIAATWTLAQVSIRGRPNALDRVSIAADLLRLDRAVADRLEILVQIDHVELHGRPSPNATADDAAIDVAASFTGVAASGPAGSIEPAFDGEVTAALHGMKDWTPKPLAVRLREFQAAGGRLELTNVRVKQGETVAVASGALALTARGRLDGTLRLTVVGLEPFIARHGGLANLAASLEGQAPPGSDRDRLGSILTGLDRLMPGLSGDGRHNPNGGALTASIALIGERTELDGRPAVVLPLRFADGAAYLGPIPIGQTPPLF